MAVAVCILFQQKKDNIVYIEWNTQQFSAAVKYNAV